MPSDLARLSARLETLELSARRSWMVAVVACIALAGSWLTGASRWQQPQASAVVRTRLLVIQDERGRDRIVLGAPMPDGRDYVGMKILNPDGNEQFGLSLKADGAVGMGFDVRPGVGNPANRERLNMGVTTTGQGWIRYLDNETRARLLVRLDSADVPWVQFLDWPDNQRIVMRQIGFAGESKTEIKR